MNNAFYQGLIVIVIFFVGLVGWGLNVLNIIATENVDHVGLLVIQVVGVIIPPLGAVLGYVI
jgi:hypothetical protein